MARRIVIGQREDGRSSVLRDEELEQDFRGVGSYRLWAADDLASLRLPFLDAAVPLDSTPTSEQTPEALRTAPPQPQRGGQWRVSLHEMPPGHDGEDFRPFLHWHNTFDLQWLMSGALTISLDGGDQVEMAPGDVVIQHGTNHAWEAGPEGAIMAIFMYGAERVGVEPPAGDLLDPARWVRQAEHARGSGAPPSGLNVHTDVADFISRDPRRIVTAQSEDGRSVFAQTGPVAADAAGDYDGVTLHQMWADDELLPIKLPYLSAAVVPPSVPTTTALDETSRPSRSDLGPGGLRVSLIKISASETGRQYELCWHDTIDVQWLFAGELSISLDDGSEVTLEPGDAVVQHGANHSWRVGPKGAIVAQVMLGVERDSLAPPSPAVRLA
jgi:uncharacterized cupin superfamily protein